MNLNNNRKKEDLINIQTFVNEKDLVFSTNKQCVRWIKRHLKPKLCVKVGVSYMVSREEIEKLFEVYLTEKKLMREKRLMKKD